MTADERPGGRRERATEDKRRRILESASSPFRDHGGGGVTMQQIAERADVAVGTFFLSAATKAELLIRPSAPRMGPSGDQRVERIRVTVATAASTTTTAP